MKDARLLTAAELMDLLGMKKSLFYKKQKQGYFKFLELPRPVSRARYSRVLFERYCQADSFVNFGKGSRPAHLRSVSR